MPNKKDTKSNTKIKPGQGKLLVSDPHLKDPYFARAVILLIEHGKEGSMGFVLNKPLEVHLNELVPDFPVFEGNIYLGGPVNKNNIFYIHTLGEKINAEQEILPGIYWGGDFELLKVLISENKVKENELRFFAGYSGWDPKQLNRELKENSWIVANGNKELIMNGNSDTLWSDVLKSMGNTYSLLANFPEDPMLN